MYIVLIAHAHVYILTCRIVRLISPNLNYITIIGAIFLYMSVLGFVFPTTKPQVLTPVCHVSIIMTY